MEPTDIRRIAGIVFAAATAVVVAFQIALTLGAAVVDGASTLDVDDPSVIKGKRVLAIEDGPTLPHGEMKIGAAVVAAQKFGAAGFVDPLPFTGGKLKDTFKTYPNIGVLLPAMGYDKQ